MKIVAAIFVLLIISSFVYLFFAPPVSAPTDENLRISFVTNRDSFEKLGQPFLNDQTLIAVSDESFDRLADQGVVSRSKLTDVDQVAFARTGILYGGRSGVSDLAFIKFPAYRRKMNLSDFSQQNYEEKGYALMTSPPDKVHEILGSGGIYGNTEFKQLDGKWYIYQGIWVSKPE